MSSTPTLLAAATALALGVGFSAPQAADGGQTKSVVLVHGCFVDGSGYLVATEGKMIPPDAQRFMSQRAGSTVVEAAGSHAIYVSQAPVVADLIEAAAENTGSVAQNQPNICCRRTDHMLWRRCRAKHFLKRF